MLICHLRIELSRYSIDVWVMVVCVNTSSHSNLHLWHLNLGHKYEDMSSHHRRCIRMCPISLTSCQVNSRLLTYRSLTICMCLSVRVCVCVSLYACIRDRWHLGVYINSKTRLRITAEWLTDSRLGPLLALVVSDGYCTVLLHGRTC